jgi:type IV pilus biogenesis protein PilP
MEMDTLSGRAEQEQQILQNEKSRLEAEAAKIEQEKRALEAAAEAGDYSDTKVAKDTQKKKTSSKKPAKVESDEEDISSLYKLVNVMGAGNQLQATLSDLETGQTKRVSVGKVISGFTVKSISLEDGVVFSKDGETQNLNISSR